MYTLLLMALYGISEVSLFSLVIYQVGLHKTLLLKQGLNQRRRQGTVWWVAANEKLSNRTLPAWSQVLTKKVTLPFLTVSSFPPMYMGFLNVEI